MRNLEAGDVPLDCELIFSMHTYKDPCTDVNEQVMKHEYHSMITRLQLDQR